MNSKITLYFIRISQFELNRIEEIFHNTEARFDRIRVDTRSWLHEALESKKNGG